MIYLPIFIILFYVLSFTEAFREAYLSHAISKLGSKLHCEVKYSFLSKIQRILIFLIMIVSLLYFIGWISLFFIVGLVLTLPYIHNGTYFVIRNRLNPEVFRCKENCDISQNEIKERPTFYINNVLRKNLAIIGIITQIVGVYLLINI